MMTPSSSVMFGARVHFQDRQNRLSSEEVKSLKLAFDDDIVGQRITGKKQTMRQWLDENLHDALDISFQRGPNATDNRRALTMQLSIHDQGLLEAHIGDNSFRSSRTGKSYSRRAMLSFMQNTLRPLLLWSRAIEDTIGPDRLILTSFNEAIAIGQRKDELEEEYKDKPIPFPQPKAAEPAGDQADFETIFQEAIDFANARLK